MPPDPGAEEAERRWKEFKAQKGDGRIAVFLATLEEDGVIDSELAFEMLDLIHNDAETSGSRDRFTECVEALRRRRPEVFAEDAHFYLNWRLLDALAEDRQEVVSWLARELAQTAGRQIDIFNRSLEALAYHGQLEVLVDVLRIAWPLVKDSDDIVPWGISEFAERGANYEILHYIQTNVSPDPIDPVLLERIRFFVDEPRLEYIREFIEDLTGKSQRHWRTEDFTLRIPRKRRDEDWEDESEDEDEDEADPGAGNLNRLVSEFVGYAREQGMPFPRGELVRQDLFRYFLERSRGDLDPRPNMVEQVMGSRRKLPKPPRPAHPLCPERVTLDRYLARLLNIMSGRYHSAAALFQAMPAWLRFLESRGLIDVEMSNKVTTELRPLHNTLLGILQEYTDDPHLHRRQQAWPLSN